MHRDIKPANVFLMRPNDLSSLKIGDFGLALACEPWQQKSERAGSPYYVAPEVLSQNFSQGADLWSCGVLLFYALSGYHPFTGGSMDAIFRQIMLGRPDMAHGEGARQWGRVSKEAKALVRRLLTKARGARFVL